MAEKILVVDDDQDLRETLSMFLTRQNYEVHGAPNGLRGWELLHQNKYDLVLLDIMMPGMSGFDVLDKIRQDPKLKDMPIIMITALDQTTDVVKAFEKGATDYVSKPFVNAELIARVSTALRYRRIEQERARGAQLQTFKTMLSLIAREMNTPLIQLTRCSRQLFRKVAEPDPEMTTLRKNLYDQCVRIQVILKQLEKIKSLSVDSDDQVLTEWKES